MNIHEFNAFLETTRHSIRQDTPLHLVLGNESADPDSVVSSLMYAYFCSNSTAFQDTAMVPLANIRARELRLRPEVIFLLKDTGIDPALLLFRDQIDLKSAARRKGFRITLVDHNDLAPRQTFLEAYVDAVIDHHPDSGRFGQAAPRIIEPVASTATLIARLILARHPALLDPSLAKLLLGPILLDSVNLDPEARRCSARDHHMVARLAALAGIDPTPLYESLVAARGDVTGMSVRDLLERDLKLGSNPDFAFGVSAVPTRLMQWIAQNPDLPEKINRFARNRNLDLFLVLTYYPNPRFQRWVLAWSPDPQLTDGLLAWFNAHDTRLSPMNIARGGENMPKKFRIWRQQNIHQSRKHLIPLLKSYCPDLKSG